MRVTFPLIDVRNIFAKIEMVRKYSNFGLDETKLASISLCGKRVIKRH